MEERNIATDELSEELRKAWAEALPAYLEWKGCQLGLCSQVEALEEVAKTHLDQKTREEAQQKQAALRFQKERKWLRAARRVEQLHLMQRVQKAVQDGSF